MVAENKPTDIQWRRTKWREALESEEYNQDIGNLRTEDDWCCLGVACDVYKKLTGKGRWVRTQDYDVKSGTVFTGMVEKRIYAFVPHGGRRTRQDDTTCLPKEVAEFFNMTVEGDLAQEVQMENKEGGQITEKSLMGLNDQKVSFKDIATLITNYQDDYKSFLKAYQ